MNLLGEHGDSMLREGARRALADASPHASLAASPEAAGAIAARHWSMAGDLGWTAVLLAEADGGVGLGLEELVELCEEMGAHLFCGPWLGTAVLAPCLATLARRRDASFDGPRPGDAVGIAAAIPNPDRQTGSRYLGEHPGLSTHYVFVDATDGDRLRFRLREASNVDILARPAAMDPACPLALLAPPTDAADFAIETGALDAALMPFHLAVAAELTGIAAAAVERSLAWVNERRQFGRPVGSFQAVKHRLADTYVSFAKSLRLTRDAAASGDAAACAMARVLAADAAVSACRGLVQHLGGAGISWETDAHLYLKRALRLTATPPSTALLRRRSADLFIDSLDAANSVR